jgi:putative (di)nucleoside polyphosphate hydrolase
MNDFLYRKGANAFVIFGDKFLVVQKLSYGSNQWDIPGGGIDDGETPEIGVLRELEEELGTTKFELLGESDVINKYDWPEEAQQDAFEKSGKWYKGQEKHQFLVRFLGKKKDIKFHENELKQIKWVTEDELKNHLIFEGQWASAKESLESFRTKGLL